VKAAVRRQRCRLDGSEIALATAAVVLRVAVEPLAPDAAAGNSHVKLQITSTTVPRVRSLRKNAITLESASLQSTHSKPSGEKSIS